LQKPSKNHACEDNFVPFKCLKQVNKFNVPPEDYFGFHLFEYNKDIFFGIVYGKLLFYYI
jgi:hypothetical protein